MKRSDILPLAIGVVCFTLAIYASACVYVQSRGVPGLEWSGLLILVTFSTWGAWDGFAICRWGSRATISAALGNWLAKNNSGTRTGLIAIGMLIAHVSGWSKRPKDSWPDERKETQGDDA